MDKRYKRLGKNTILVFLGNVGSRLIALLMLPFYTRWLTPAEYGTTDILTVYATLLSAFVGLAISDAIFIFPKNADENGRKSYFSTGIAFSLVSFAIGFMVFFLLDIIFKYYDIKNVLSEYLWFVYLLIIGGLVQSYTQQFTRAIDKMVVYCGTGIVHTASIAILAFVLIPEHGVNGYLLSIVLSFFITSAYTFLFSKSYDYFSLKSINKVSLIELLKYSIPLVPNGIMFWLIGSLNRPLVEHYIGLDANGILAVASKFPGIISMLFGIFANAWTISMLEEYGKKDFVSFFNTASKCILLPTIIGACLLAIFSKPFIMLFADERYWDAYLYMPIITLSILFSCIGGLIGGIFAAKKQSKYFFYSSIWGAVASIVTMFLLIPHFKLYGVTISMVLSYFVIMMVRYYFAKTDLQGFQFADILILLALYAVIVMVVPLSICLLSKVAIYSVIIGLIVYRNRSLLSTIISKIHLYKH